MTREEAIKRIKAGLKQRTGITWSVTGGHGTSWGWLRIDAPPARRLCDSDGYRTISRQQVIKQAGQGYVDRYYTENPKYDPLHYTCKLDREILARTLGLDRIHSQGESVPPGAGCYEEYVDRAEGREPSRGCTRDWD